MDQERTVLDQLLYSTRIPSVESLQTSSRIFSASAYSVTLADETEEQWPKGLVSRSYGSIEKSFQKARQAIKRGLYDMDEVARKAEQALAAEGPIEFVRHCDRKFIEDFSDYRSVRLEIDEIRQSVLEAEELLTSLDAIGQRDRYLNLVRSLNSLEREVADYIAQQTGKVIVLNWQIEETTSPRVVCLYDRAPSPEAKGFKTEDSVEYSFYHGGHPMFPRERPIEASDVLVSAQYELLAIFDKLLPSEPEL